MIAFLNEKPPDFIRIDSVSVSEASWLWPKSGTLQHLDADNRASGRLPQAVMSTMNERGRNRAILFMNGSFPATGSGSV
jgi:hypothetical protein